jgi:hypothetical protein
MINATGPVLVGPIWFTGGLFSIGFAHLGFWKAVPAVLLWPSDLGVAVA